MRHCTENHIPPHDGQLVVTVERKVATAVQTCSIDNTWTDLWNAARTAPTKRGRDVISNIGNLELVTWAKVIRDYTIITISKELKMNHG